MSEAEKNSIQNLIEETKETAEIAERFHKCLAEDVKRKRVVSASPFTIIGKIGLAPIKM